MVSSKDGKSGMNGVAVARHGLIFGEDGATGCRKVFRCLRGLWDFILISKMMDIWKKHRAFWISRFLWLGKSGMNGVAVARHGLIFDEDGATGSRKFFRGLWGLWDCICISKMMKIWGISNFVFLSFLMFSSLPVVVGDIFPWRNCPARNARGLASNF